jgi:hypothetical protein
MTARRSSYKLTQKPEVNERGGATAVPIDLDAAGELETQLTTAETAAWAVIAEHAAAVNAVFATLSPEKQRSWHLFAKMFGPPLIEHNESRQRQSKLPPRRCQRCEAARRLLVRAHEVRFHLSNGAAEAAVFAGLSVGRLQLRLGLQSVEDAAERGQAFADGPRHDRRDLLNRALEAMLADKPDLNAADVIAKWRDEPIECVQEVMEDGTVNWYASPGDERTTSANGITKRLQRLRRKLARHEEERTLID